MTATRESVLAALKNVKDPGTGDDIVSAGVTRGLNVEGGTVRFVLEIDPAKSKAYEPVLAEAQEAVRGVSGVTEVSAVLTAHSAKAPPDLQTKRKPAEPQGPQRVPGVDHIIAIASGKGGVGKSTVSPISPARWPPRAAASAFWMPMSTAPPSPGCWASRAGPPRRMARPSCRCAITASP